MICHQWTKDLFILLKKCKQEKFIPAIIGRIVFDLHRRMFALPVKFGGLGIVNPVEITEKELQTSLNITKS